MLQSLGRNEMPGLFTYFSNSAINKAFVVFTMPAKKRDHARAQDSRNIVALLEQQSTGWVKKDGTGYFSMWHMLTFHGPSRVLKKSLAETLSA